jgi:tryptophan-rich sensory protein
MKNFKTYTIPFLLILTFNFICLSLGSIFTTTGVSSEWYLSIFKAPWTPPGWVFATSWSLIAISFAFLGSFFYKKDKFLFTFYIISWILNIIWNPIFFYYHFITIAGIDILLLLVNIILLARYTKLCYGKIWLFSLPYIIWLLIASSLNWFIIFNN